MKSATSARELSKFQELEAAAKERESRRLEVVNHIKQLLVEVLPGHLQIPDMVEGKSWLHFLDCNTGEMSKDGKDLPVLFGKEAKVAFAIRVARHTYVPILLTFQHFPDRYSVSVKAFTPKSSEAMPGSWGDPKKQQQAAVVMKNKEEDLARLAELIFAVALKFLETTLGEDPNE